MLPADQVAIWVAAALFSLGLLARWVRIEPIDFAYFARLSWASLGLTLPVVRMYPARIISIDPSCGQSCLAGGFSADTLNGLILIGALGALTFTLWAYIERMWPAPPKDTPPA